MLRLRTLRARHLSRTGQHTAALSVCRMSDEYVLSRAGMHLSVLDRSERPSIEHAVALARTGRVGAALEMSRCFAGKVAARTLFGMLAVDAPQEVARLLDRQRGAEEIRAYCAFASGAEYAAGPEPISPIHTMLGALRAGRSEAAHAQFERLFLQAGLDVPDVAWGSQGMQYASLTCERYGHAIESGPLISVILTAHNEEQLLAVAVRSLLTQSWRNIELVLVDDASTDGTWAVAESLARADGRIKLVRLERQLGLWGAKNVGLQHCTGDLITMHDADDWSHYRKLEVQVAPLLRNRRVMATSSYMVRIDQDTGVPYTRNARNFLRWNPSSFMFRPELVRQWGGFLDKLLGSDCEFVARAETVFGVDTHLHVRLPLAIGQQRSASLSNRFRTGAEALVRFQDWEAWRRRHVRGELRASEEANGSGRGLQALHGVRHDARAVPL